MPDEKLRFYDLTGILPADGSDGFVTLSPSLKATSASGRTDIPVMLSNARTILGDTAAARRDMARFQQIVSFGYLATLLTDEAGKRCQGMTSPLFQTYLLQAFFADTQSLPKGLSLWSNLQFTAAPAPRSKQQPPVESDLIERMVNERLRALNTSTRQLDYRKVVDTMAPRRASVPVREQFTQTTPGCFAGRSTRFVWSWTTRRRIRRPWLKRAGRSSNCWSRTRDRRVCFRAWVCSARGATTRFSTSV